MTFDLDSLHMVKINYSKKHTVEDTGRLMRVSPDSYGSKL